MSSLLSIPAELRQSILKLTLPDINHISKRWPRSVLDLLHISQCLRLDMGPVLSIWSPIHYISYPKDLHALEAQTINLDGRDCSPKIERICLDLFHESDAAKIQRTCFCQGDAMCSHPELIAAWTHACPFLPKELKEIHLDVTPAPAAKRNQHRLVLNPFLHDKRTAKNFLTLHVRDVGALIRAIDEHYEGRVPIFLTGKLSKKSEFFITALQRASGLDVEFVGTWITAQDAHFAKISTAVERIAPKHQAIKAEQQGEPYRLEKLRTAVWSQEAKWTYAKVADVGEEAAAVEDLRLISEFLVDEEKDVLRMDPVGAVRRALQHRVAQDMGLKTVSDGDGQERHVVVEKELEESPIGCIICVTHPLW